MKYDEMKKNDKDGNIIIIDDFLASLRELWEMIDREKIQKMKSILNRVLFYPIGNFVL